MNLTKNVGIDANKNYVQATENTYALISKLKADNHKHALIVTSIQK